MKLVLSVFFSLGTIEKALFHPIFFMNSIMNYYSLNYFKLLAKISQNLKVHPSLPTFDILLPCCYIFPLGCFNFKSRCVPSTRPSVYLVSEGLVPKVVVTALRVLQVGMNTLGVSPVNV